MTHQRKAAKGGLAGRWLERAGQDLRFGVRSLARAPGFAVTAIVTLALGIGTTAAVFNLVHAVLLEPLPLPEPERLVWLEQESEGGGGDNTRCVPHHPVTPSYSAINGIALGRGLIPRIRCGRSSGASPRQRTGRCARGGRPRSRSAQRTALRW